MRVLIRGALLAALAAIWGCTEAPPERPGAGDVDDLPDIILISLDTLRSDYLSCYGYEKKTSPNLDRLAKEATLFRHAYSPTNSTVPSHTSLFTGSHISTHGIIANAGWRLDPSYLTLAEILWQQGYFTAGFTSVPHLDLQRIGLDQGFDYVVTPPFRLIAKEVNTRALRWLQESTSERPLFLFLHYFDTHTPYSPPAKHVYRFYRGDPAKPAENSMDQVELQPHQEEYFGPWLEGIEDLDFVKALYEGSIHYLDGELGRLFSRLHELDLWEESIVIVTADHGESLDEHGIYFDHLGLYEPSVTIPLIMKWPGHRSRVFDPIVQTIDIYPTLLGLLGFAPPMTDTMEGIDLTPYLRGSSPESDLQNRMLFLEHSHMASVAIRSGPWKYTIPLNPYNQLETDEELYHLGKDPEELENLAGKYPDRLKELKKSGMAWWNRPQRSESTGLKMEPTDEELEQLRALGYIN